MGSIDVQTQTQWAENSPVTIRLYDSSVCSVWDVLLSAVSWRVRPQNCMFGCLKTLLFFLKKMRSLAAQSSVHRRVNIGDATRRGDLSIFVLFQHQDLSCRGRSPSPVAALPLRTQSRTDWVEAFYRGCSSKQVSEAPSVESRLTKPETSLLVLFKTEKQKKRSFCPLNFALERETRRRPFLKVLF